MRHPFAGIIIPQSMSRMSQRTEGTRGPRRNFLQILGAVSAVLGFRRVSTASPQIPWWWCGTTPTSSPPYQLYLVTTKGYRDLPSGRRAELAILGPYVHYHSLSHPLFGKRGYLTWSSAAQAQQLRSAREVDELLPVSNSVTPLGQPSDTLLVTLSPNSWRSKPDPSTYQSTAQLIRKWSDQLARMNVRVWNNQSDRFVFVKMPVGSRDETIRFLRRQSQVSQIQWTSAVTSTAIGEEGGPSTRALGEEGGAGPTTQALGEEGGPSTRALGEEGGTRPTTKALGEEGGKRPTTMAIGEEGGKVPSTEALGEEGGRRPVTRAFWEGGRGRPKPAITTFALGEEGGR